MVACNSKRINVIIIIILAAILASTEASGKFKCENGKIREEFIGMKARLETFDDHRLDEFP